MRNPSPIRGRWLTPDPAGAAAANPAFPQTWNAYAYVNGDPLEETDPTGMWCWLGIIGNTCDREADGDGEVGYDPFIDGKPSISANPGAIAKILKVLRAARPLAPGLGGPACSEHTLVALDPKSPGAEFTLADSSVHPWFSPAMAADLTAAIGRLNREGIVPQLNSGFRFADVQNGLYDGGAGPGAALSLHEAGYAADFQQKGAIAGAMRASGLKWGGNFSLPDRVHYYLDLFGKAGSPAYESALAAAASAAAQFALACF